MRNLLMLLLLSVVLLGYFSVFIVNEGQVAIVSRVGEFLKDSEDKAIIYRPGLHLKIPFVDHVNYLNSKIQTIDSSADRFITSEQKDLIVNSYIKWRIVDFGEFFKKTGNGNTNIAKSLLLSRINDSLRREFGLRNIKEIVSGERDELQRSAYQEANKAGSSLGIEVIDVRVKQINLPEEVSNYIYNRMRAKRAAVARSHRYQGKEKGEKIRADADKQSVVIVSEADKTARVIKGEGDAQAAKIYADSYMKNPDFYIFLRSLDAYQASFNSKDDVLVVSPDSDFFKYMKTTQY